MRKLRYWVVGLFAEIGAFFLALIILWILTDLDMLAVLAIDCFTTLLAGLMIFKDKLK